MTCEFKAVVLANGQIAVPSEIAGQIPAGTELQVALAWETATDADSYRALASKLREASYAEETVYDSLA
jgi:hypothetical protein